MARRRVRPAPGDQGELDFNARTAITSKRSRTPADVEKAAHTAIARRARSTPSKDHVKITLTLYLSREQAERLAARAIREEKNLEALVAEILETASE